MAIEMEDVSVLRQMFDDPRRVRAYTATVVSAGSEPGTVNIDSGDGETVQQVPVIGGAALAAGTDVLVLTFDRQIWAVGPGAAGGGGGGGTPSPDEVAIRPDEPSVIAGPYPRLWVDTDDTSINPDWLTVAGGVLTGPLIAYRDPSVDLEVATKRYVDSSIIVPQRGVKVWRQDFRPDNSLVREGDYWIRDKAGVDVTPADLLTNSSKWIAVGFGYPQGGSASTGPDGMSMVWTTGGPQGQQMGTPMPFVDGHTYRVEVDVEPLSGAAAQARLVWAFVRDSGVYDLESGSVTTMVIDIPWSAGQNVYILVQSPDSNLGGGVQVRGIRVLDVTESPSETYVYDDEMGWTLLRTALIPHTHPGPDYTWTDLTLQNGWSNYLNGFQTAQYRKIGDEVQLRGLVRLGTAGSVIATLPDGFRPPATLIMAAVHDVGVNWATGAASAGTAHTHSQTRPTTAAYRIGISVTGDIGHYSTQGTGYVDLSMIRFSVTP